MYYEQYSCLFLFNKIYLYRLYKKNIEDINISFTLISKGMKFRSINLLYLLRIT